MKEMDYQTLYEKIQNLVADDALCRSVIDVIESEREKAEKKQLQAQAEGIARARAASVPLGRPKIAKPKNYAQVIKLYLAHELTIDQAASLLKVSRSVCYSWICQEREKL